MNDNAMRWSVLAAVLGCGLSAQSAAPEAELRAKFARAVVIEEHEHDPARAASAFREVVAGARGDLRAEASLRLGAALMATGKREDARAAVAEVLAAGGTLGVRAQAVLDGQDQADKFLAKRVEAALATLRTHAGNGQQELLFLGRPATPLIAARLRADLAAGVADQRTGGTLVEVLCLLGGKVSADCLSELASSSDLFARRLVAHVVGTPYGNSDFDSEVLAALALFTRDSDATIRADVTRMLGKRLPLARCVELAIDADPGVRKQAFACLQSHLEAMPAGVPCPDEVLQALRRAFDESDVGVRAEIRRCLGAACVQRNSAGRRLAIAALAHSTLGFAMAAVGMWFEAPNEHAEDLAAAAQALASRGEKLDRLQGLIQKALQSNEWNVDAWPQVLAILDAGYRDAAPWLAKWVGTDPARGVQLVERLGKLAPDGVAPALNALAKLELPKDAFAPLEAWQDEPPQRGKAMLMTLVDDDRASAWLLAAAGKTVSAIDVARTLIERGPTPRRNALILQLVLHRDLDHLTRSQTINVLLNRGDERVIEQIGRVYEQGLQASLQWQSMPEAQASRVADCLMASGSAAGFREVAGVLASSGPVSFVEPILRHALKCPVSGRGGSPLPESFFKSVFAFRALSQAQRTDLAVRLAANPEFLDPLVAVLASSPVELPRDLIPMLRARLDGEAGQDHRATHYLTVITRIGGPTIPGLLRELLRHVSPQVRFAAAINLAKVDESAAADLVAIGDDPSAMVRGALVQVANDLPDPRFVPGLLRLMRTAAGDRDQVQKAIELIDFHANQTARWKRMLEGQGLDAPSAAEALVKQAKPGNDKPVRLAAIASLGTLKVPETLPVLVDLLRDADAEVRAAAEAALAKINAGGR